MNNVDTGNKTDKSLAGALDGVHLNERLQSAGQLLRGLAQEGRILALLEHELTLVILLKPQRTQECLRRKTSRGMPRLGGSQKANLARFVTAFNTSSSCTLAYREASVPLLNTCDQKLSKHSR